MVPTELNKTFWIAYGFTLVMFIIEGTIWVGFFQNNQNLTSRFYKIPVLTVCNIYLIVQVILFLIFKISPSIPSWITITMNLILMAASIIGFITLGGATEYVTDVDKKVQSKVSYIRNLHVEAELLSKDISNADIKKMVEEVAEKIRFSDPMSDDTLWELEQQITENISAMKRSS